MNKSGVYPMKLYITSTLTGHRRLNTFHVFNITTTEDRNTMRQVYRIIRNSGQSAFKTRRLCLEMMTMGHYSETSYNGEIRFTYASVGAR